MCHFKVEVKLQCNCYFYRLSIAILTNHREDLSADFQKYMVTAENPEDTWSGIPDLEYFMRMVK